MDDDVKVNEEYYSKGILESGIEAVLAKNDKLYNEVKSGTWSQTFNTDNLNYKVGAVNGERYVQYEQKNIEEVKQFCKERREFHKAHGTDNPFFAGTAHMMQLPSGSTTVLGN